MSGINFVQKIAIACSIFFADNSKALVVYSQPTPSSVAIGRPNSPTFRSRQGQISLKPRRNLIRPKFDKSQIKRKYKHAPDFNIEGSPTNPTKGQVANFQDKLQQHVTAEKTLIIKGTYKKNIQVVHYLDPDTKVNVMVDPDGRFVSGWKLSDAQFDNVKSRGSL